MTQDSGSSTSPLTPGGPHGFYPRDLLVVAPVTAYYGARGPQGPALPSETVRGTQSSESEGETAPRTSAHASTHTCTESWTGVDEGGWSRRGPMALYLPRDPRGLPLVRAGGVGPRDP